MTLPLLSSAGYPYMDIIAVDSNFVSEQTCGSIKCLYYRDLWQVSDCRKSAQNLFCSVEEAHSKCMVVEMLPTTLGETNRKYRRRKILIWE